jgi:hypothetical protein
VVAVFGVVDAEARVRRAVVTRMGFSNTEGSLLVRRDPSAARTAINKPKASPVM